MNITGTEPMIRAARAVIDSALAEIFTDPANIELLEDGRVDVHFKAEDGHGWVRVYTDDDNDAALVELSVNVSSEWAQRALD